MRILPTFKGFPPRQSPGSFNVEQALEGMRAVSAGGR